MKERIDPRSGTAFLLNAGELLRVIDPEGEQVSDLTAYNAQNIDEYLSSGRSIDYAGKIFFSKGDVLYSNRSVPMLSIIQDDVGRHDFILTPCSREMFIKIYGPEYEHKGCQGNLEDAMATFNVSPDRIPTTFNIFMHVAVDEKTGAIEVRPPLSKPGDAVTFRAEMDLIVGLTACSAGQSNNFAFKPIDYEIVKTALQNSD